MCWPCNLILVRFRTRGHFQPLRHVGGLGLGLILFNFFPIIINIVGSVLDVGAVIVAVITTLDILTEIDPTSFVAQFFELRSSEFERLVSTVI